MSHRRTNGSQTRLDVPYSTKSSAAIPHCTITRNSRQSTCRTIRVIIKALLCAAPNIMNLTPLLQLARRGHEGCLNWIITGQMNEPSECRRVLFAPRAMICAGVVSALLHTDSSGCGILLPWCRKHCSCSKQPRESDTEWDSRFSLNFDHTQLRSTTPLKIWVALKEGDYSLSGQYCI
jgi:hypothetical protein